MHAFLKKNDKLKPNYLLQQTQIGTILAISKSKTKIYTTEQFQLPEMNFRSSCNYEQTKKRFH